MEIFLEANTWVALLTLTFLEIVLGIDNIVFISITANKLPEKKRKRATYVGLGLAMITRVLLLLSISVIIGMKDPFWHIKLSWLEMSVTGQSMILFAGGLFLLYKSTKEIHHKVDDATEEDEEEPVVMASFSRVITQIVLIDIVFSFDSILTAVGMTNGVKGSLTIMITAIIISMLIMMLFANAVSHFVNSNPTIQMLGLSFLILIGFMLIAEGAHLAHAEIFNNSVGIIPKGYLYFAIAFSLGVETLNMKIRKKK